MLAACARLSARPARLRAISGGSLPLVRAGWRTRPSSLALQAVGGHVTTRPLSSDSMPQPGPESGESASSCVFRSVAAATAPRCPRGPRPSIVVAGTQRGVTLPPRPLASLATAALEMANTSTPAVAELGARRDPRPAAQRSPFSSLRQCTHRPGAAPHGRGPFDDGAAVVDDNCQHHPRHSLRPSSPGPLRRAWCRVVASAPCQPPPAPSGPP